MRNSVIERVTPGPACVLRGCIVLPLLVGCQLADMFDVLDASGGAVGTDGGSGRDASAAGTGGGVDSGAGGEGGLDPIELEL
jgi:hypothetical protein